MKRFTWLLLGSALILSGCGVDSTETNEIGLVYEGGVVQDKTYRGILQPGSTADSVGLGSSVYRYRTDQRTYIACIEVCDTDPVEIVTRDGVRMLVYYQLYFKLNLEEATLRAFHENLGVKTEAWTEEGWEQLLFEYFEPQIARAMEDAALTRDWRALRSDEAVRTAFRHETVANLKRNVFEVIGRDYFCGPAYNGPGTECGEFTFTIGTPVPVNEAIVQAVEAEQTAVAETVAQEQRNARTAKELEIERALVELYGPQGALLREAIESGQVQIMVVPEGAPIAVPTP